MLKLTYLPVVMAMGVGLAQAAESPREVRQEQRRQNVQQNKNERIERREQNVLDRTPQQRVNQQNNAQLTVNDQSQVGNHEQQLERQIADCLLLHNQEEINLARFAAQHAQSDQVKKFAQMMIHDHEEFGKKLQKYAGHGDMHQMRDQRSAQDGQQAAPIPNGQTFQNDQNRPSASRLEGNTARNIQNVAPDATNRQVQNAQSGERMERTAAYGSAMSISDQWYQIEQEAVKNCQQMTEECLNKEQGKHFDQAYLGSQIGVHIGMLAHMKAVESHVSGDFQQLVRDGEQTVQKHKQRAEELKKQLMSDHQNQNNQ